MKPSPRISLNNGVLIDQLGFGLYKVPPREAATLVSTALGEGYRHFDTASMYGNEAGVGRGIGGAIGRPLDGEGPTGGSGEATHGISREDVFITTKVWNDDHGSEAPNKGVENPIISL